MVRKAKFTLPVAVIGGFLPIVHECQYWYKQGGINALTTYIPPRLIPYNTATGKWDFSLLRLGLYPIIAGYLVHMVANRLGINRAIARAGVPLIRL